MNRPIICTLITYYLPGYKSGGPVRTIANMVDHLGDELDFRIVTADHDAVDTQPYQNVDIDAWNTVGKAKVFYASRGNRSVNNLARLMRETTHDILYLNSFFDPVFTLFPLLARTSGLVPRRPTVIAPRGEFSKGALALKAWKKRPYLRLTGALGLYRDLTWQASSEHEAEDIQRVVGRRAQRICMAPNLPATLPVENSERASPTTDRPLYVAFLARIAPKKNLDLALRVLARVRVPVEFYIYGPIWDEAYWRQCQDLIKALPAHVSVHYQGSVPPESVPNVLATYDLFFFPTRGENFGHVILEALSVGTPVLTSDKTPWADNGSSGCMTLSLENEDDFVAAIERLDQLTPEERTRMQAGAQAVARAFVEGDGLRERNLALFREAYSANLGAEVKW